MLFVSPATASACQPHIVSIEAAPAPDAASLPPERGWVPVTLPDTWNQRWEEQGTVWYRLVWLHECAPNQPTALAVSHISMAGEIWLNDILLWRDASLSEPFSRSWNMPRYWLLPDAALSGEENTLLFRVTGMPQDVLGLGEVALGDPSTVWPWYEAQHRQKRQLFTLNATASLVLSCLFLAFWAVRRQDTAYGWYALASLAWAMFASTMLATSPWPFSDSADWNRAVTLLLTIHVYAFCMFTWRFGDQHFPRLSRLLTGLTLVLAGALWWVPDAVLTPAVALIILGYSLMFLANCIQFQFHTWRHRERHNILLALCLMAFLFVALRDVLVIVSVVDGNHLLAPVTSPIAMVFMFLIIADRFATSLRRIERFNTSLKTAVEKTRDELTATLRRKHELEASNIRLSERLRLSHDLHDSLGSTLVRSIASVEQCDHTLDNRRFLSMLRDLRDDLRQVIDNSSPYAQATTTPAEWIASLRHRFVSLFDEIGVASHWHLPAVWPCQVSPAQRLALIRFMEEALSNAIKHSQADTIEVAMHACADGGLVLHVYDNGVGFDVDIAGEGKGVGMHSMAARVARIGGRLEIHSVAGETRLSVWLSA